GGSCGEGVRRRGTEEGGTPPLRYIHPRPVATHSSVPERTPGRHRHRHNRRQAAAEVMDEVQRYALEREPRTSQPRQVTVERQVEGGERRERQEWAGCDFEWSQREGHERRPRERGAGETGGREV